MPYELTSELFKDNDRLQKCANEDRWHVVPTNPPQAGPHVRLIQRADGPVYVVSGGSKPVAIHAADLSDAAVVSDQAALQIAQMHARLRGIDRTTATLAGIANYDQWSVPNGFDEHRPLYRVALHAQPLPAWAIALVVATLAALIASSRAAAG